MGLFKPDWERTARIVYAVGETLASGTVPSMKSKDDERTVQLISSALEKIIKGVVAVVKRHKS